MDIANSVTKANILLNATLLEIYLSAIAPENVTVFLEALYSSAMQVHIKEQSWYTLCFDKKAAKVLLSEKSLGFVVNQHAIASFL